MTKTILIIGGSRGIGALTAIKVAKKGYHTLRGWGWSYC